MNGIFSRGSPDGHQRDEEDHVDRETQHHTHCLQEKRAAAGVREAEELQNQPGSTGKHAGDDEGERQNHPEANQDAGVDQLADNEIPRRLRALPDRPDRGPSGVHPAQARERKTRPGQ